MTSLLANRTVLVTGSSRGIGAATARAASAQGAHVVLHGRTKSDALIDLSEELHATYVTADVTDRDEVFAAVTEALQQVSRIDALVNCAGEVNPKPFLELTKEDWYRELDVNLLGTAWFCQAVLPSMVANNYGRIVNVSSIRGIPTSAAARGIPYTASKGAVVNLTAALAKEFGPAVNVNCVAPGFVLTDMSQTWSEPMWDLAKTSLAERAGEPEEIANILVFLASEGASFVTGQTIVADGGYIMAGK